MLDQAAPQVPFVDLDATYYKLVGEFDKRFPDGAPSLRQARSLTVTGDVVFGQGVTVRGEVALTEPTGRRLDPGAVLGATGEASDG